MKIYIAPVQGHTTVAWRYFHHKIYGGQLKYFTPFMRLERGELRFKDLRDFGNPLNEGIDLVPQVIFRDMEELDILLRSLTEAGAKAVNLNMGCPFPPQMAKGRGASFITNLKEAAKLPELRNKYPEMKFSIKMRLGKESPDEWKGLIDTLNSLELDNLYIHPRVARQQYSGELFLDSFAEFLDASSNPVVFNGDIRTPGEMKQIEEQFPTINGIMIARGLLGRPSLSSEYVSGEWDKETRIEKMLEFHRELFEYYQRHLCGDSQILSNIKPFWEYAESEIGRKAWKALKKAPNLSKYTAALSQI